MIKISAINGAAKKAALGAMLAGSVAGYASNPVKTAVVDNPNHTEVVSQKAAEALKALAYPLQQQKKSVPTEHNKKLDNKFLKFCDNDEEKKEINEMLSNIYNDYGSYLGSAVVQQYLDLNMFLEFLDGNVEILKRFDEEAYKKIDREAMKKVAEKSGPIIDWLNENYFAFFNEPFGKFDHQPNAEELIKAMDDFVKKDPGRVFNYGAVYNIESVSSKKKLDEGNMNNLQKNSNLIAAKTHAMSESLFLYILKDSKLYRDYYDLSTFKNYDEYMEAVKPVKW